MGNSIWLRLLLLLSEKSTCFICMQGLQTEEEVEQGRGRQGRPKLSWNRRGAKQRQSGRNSEACEARFDKFVKIAAATVTEESAEEKTMMMIKMELEMIKKNMLAKHLQFSQEQRKHFLFIERDETRKNVYSPNQQAASGPKHTPASPHYTPFPTTRCCTQRSAVCVPLPRLSVALPPAALFGFD